MLASGGITLAPGSYTAQSAEEHIVALLKKQKLISVGQVGINLAYDQNYMDKTSQITFGGYDTNIITNSNQFIFENTADRSSWAVYLNQFGVGSFQINYNASAMKAFINPIYHNIMYPQACKTQY